MALKKKELITNKLKPGPEDLLVFGYSCKLFRDDERARLIDQGKHLIPWMGNYDLKIDRYDARGTLSDLRHAEAPSGGFDRSLGLTETEKRVELLCDEERYRALHTNEDEENLYQEEELKRLEAAIGDGKGSYGQVQYSYEGKEDTGKPTEDPHSPTVEVDAPFVPSPLLDIPLNMALPENSKQNAVIEKTASFIGNQGPQMEILLKMKQADNPLFDFLAYDNPLHGYYRLVLEATKSGRYKPVTEDEQEESEEDEDDDEHYLHPSLAPAMGKVESAPVIPSIAYKPSADCAYTMLVTKLKDKATATSQSTQDDLTEQNMECEDSDSLNLQSSVDPTAVVTPPEELQIIIHKMASYVAKNGDDFELVVRSKNDPRFDFLDPGHKYRGYYELKLAQFKGAKEEEEPVSEPKPAPETEPRPELEERPVAVKQGEPRKIEDTSRGKVAPVSFSIKPKETESNIIEKSAFPIEESSEDENDPSPTKSEPSEPVPVKTDSYPDTATDSSYVGERSDRAKKSYESERIKDKLTAAVREKIASSAKGKQIQLERKKRVAAFLKSLSGPNPSSGATETQAVEGTAYDSDVVSLPEALDISEHITPVHSASILGKRTRSGSGSNENEVPISPASVSSDSSDESHRRRSSKSSKSHKSKKKSAKKYKKKKQKSKSRRKHSSSKKGKKHKRRSSPSDSSDSD